MVKFDQWLLLLYLGLYQLCKVFVDRKNLQMFANVALLSFYSFHQACQMERKLIFLLRIAILRSGSVPSGVGYGGGVATGVVVGVAPKLGGKSSKDGSGVINLKGLWGGIITKEFEEPDEEPESPESLSGTSLTLEDDPVLGIDT